MRRLLPILGLVVLAVACADGATPARTSDPGRPTGTAPPGRPAVVEQVVDGDSLRAVVDGAPVEVRLQGINAPERDECWADAARDALQGLVAGAEITLVGHDLDQFGRLLAVVYAGPLDVNRSLLEDGHAIATAGEHPLLADFLAAEADAFSRGRGLWARDACGPALDHGVRILHLEPDAPGRDDTNPNGEFIQIANQGDAIDMTGWAIRDESSVHRFRFPAGFVLGAGAIVTVRSGPGVDAPDTLYWGADTTVWSNAGDTALLLEPSGAIADRVRYAG